MPFQSKAQARKCFASHDPNWDCDEWAKETQGGIQRLPDHTKAVRGLGQARHHLRTPRKDSTRHIKGK